MRPRWRRPQRHTRSGAARESCGRAPLRPGPQKECNSACVAFCLSSLHRPNRPVAAGFSVSMGLAVSRWPRQLNCNRSRSTRSRKCQGRSGLRRSRKIAQLNSAYRLVKKNARPGGPNARTDTRTFKKPNKPSFPGSMQSIATSRALPGPTQESKNRSFWWTREPFIGLAPAAWFFPNLFRITNRQKNEELLMRAIPVILALGSLSAIQPGPGCPIFKEVENTRASRSKKGPQTSIDAGIDAELALLRRIKIRVGQARAGGAATSGLALGIGDDCALLRPRAGEDFAITTDLSLAGRHFRLDWHPAESVGHRTLARGLSDLAAMGARPAAAFLSLAIPAEMTVAERGASWVERFLNGLLALADQ